MSLLDAFSKEYVMMIKDRQDDGHGGFNVVWRESDVKFRMPERHETTIQARQAEQEGIVSTHAFLPDKDMKFEKFDVFKRVHDGQYFRVTDPSGEDYTPYESSLNKTLIYAVKWDLKS